MIVSGGDTIQESIFNRLNVIKERYSDEDIVIVHDGVRPFITSSIISENIRMVKECGTEMTGFRSTDTLVTTTTSSGGQAVEKVSQSDILSAAFYIQFQK